MSRCIYCIFIVWMYTIHAFDAKIFRILREATIKTLNSLGIPLLGIPLLS